MPLNRIFDKSSAATTHANHGKKSLLPAVGSINVIIEVLKARNLVAKDRNLLRKRTTSDPFVIVYQVSNGEKKEIGRTETIGKNLNPVWNQKLDLVLDGDDRVIQDGIDLLYEVYDEDVVTSHDFMGSVLVHLDLLQPTTEKWYPVGKGSSDDENNYCERASGELHLVMSVSGRCAPSLVTGNHFNLDQLRTRECLKIGFGFNNPDKVEVDVSCVAVDYSGKAMFKHSVFTGNPEAMNSGAFLYQKKDTDNASLGYDYLIELRNAPEECLAYYFILTVLSNNANLDQLTPIRARFFPNGAVTSVCEIRPQSCRVDSTAVVLFRLIRRDSVFKMMGVIDESYADVQDFGGLLPHLQSYSFDLMSAQATHNLSREKATAVMGTGRSIFINDYVGESTESITFASAWTLSSDEVDLDLSAICLDEDHNELEIISFRQFISRDKAIQHSGDSRRDDNESFDTDESIKVSLPSVLVNVHHIAFAINCHSGQEFAGNCSRIVCRLVNPATGGDIAIYNMANPGSTIQEKCTGLVLACLSRDPDNGWKFTTMAVGTEDNVGHNSIPELQKLLPNKSHLNNLGLCKPARISKDEELPSMPLYEPSKTVDKERILPAFEFVRHTSDVEIEL